MSSHSRSSRRGRTFVPNRLIAWTLPGAMLGVLLAREGGARMERPTQLSRDEWDVVSPALDESLANPDLGRGVSITEGALVIRKHAFHRADILSHRGSDEITELEIELHDDSGPLAVVLRGDGVGPPLFLHLSHHAFYNDATRSWTERSGDGPWIVRLANGAAALQVPDGAVGLGQISPGKVEFTAAGEEVRVESMRLVDRTGRVTLDNDFGQSQASLSTLLAMTAIGALMGTCGSLVGSPLLAVALALPACIVPFVPSSIWLSVVERMYLVSTPNWLLARLAAIVSLTPLLAGALVGSGLLTLPRSAARRDWLLRAVPGVLLLVFQPTSWLGLAWFALLVIANARLLLEQHAARATNFVFALLLLAPASLEWAVRGTYLEEGWDAARLSGEAAPTVAWKTASPFWSGQCQGESADRRISLVFTGGSSTGGAYQFRGEPEAFFPARVLAKLCDSRPAGVTYSAANYGDGGRDSYTVSRAIDTYMAASGSDIVVFYGGVNDLLTTNNTMTRKQREERESQQGAAVSGLASLAASSRLITGLSLPFHPPDATTGAHVQDVPLPDAEENLRMLAEKVGAAGGRLILATEYVRDDSEGLLKSYAVLEASIAASMPNVSHVEVQAAMEAFSNEQLLVDRNHLSRVGADHLADFLLPAILTESVP